MERRQVRKNNGVVLEGLLVFSPDQNLAPTIYLDRFLEAYRSGMTFQEVVRKMLAAIGEPAPTIMLDLRERFGRV